MTEMFAATTTRRLTFWETDTNVVQSIAPRSRVVVTVNEAGQHIMTARAGGKVLSRIGNQYTPDHGEPRPRASEVGGTGTGTEYGDKLAALALKLAQLPYPGMQAWADVDASLCDLYTEDAREILHSYPHLLSGMERERLAPAFPELAI